MRRIDGDKLVKVLDKCRLKCVKESKKRETSYQEQKLLELERQIYMGISLRILSGEFDVKGD
jgi:hypothetical protein